MDFREKLKENTKKAMEDFPKSIVENIISDMNRLGLFKETELEKQMGRIMPLSALGTGDINKALAEVDEVINTGEFPEEFSSDFMGCTMYLRDHLMSCWSYSLITGKFVNALSNYIGDKRVLEVMAGRGLLSAMLKDKGANIITTDNNGWGGSFKEYSYTDIEIIDAEEAVMKYGKDIEYILLSWPPMGEDGAYRTLKAMREVNPDAKMIYIGEIRGCTADDQFFEHAEKVWEDDFYKVQKVYEPFGFTNDKPYLIK